MKKIKAISISLIFIINLIIISNFDDSYNPIDDPEEILEFEDSNINSDNIQNTRNSNRDIWIDSFIDENYIESKENVDITDGDAILKSEMKYTITSTSEFDTGTKNDVVTETDEYQIPSGQIQVESPCYERDSSLVLFLPLNEGTGSTANDESTYNNDGTISGATWVNGKYEKALDFDGSNDYVVIQDQNEFTISTTGTLSVQFWLKTGNDITTRQDIISKGGLNGAGNKEWATRIMNGEFHAVTISSSPIASIRGEKASISANTWYHITVVYTGYTYTSDIEIYLNGVESSSVFLQSDLIYTNTNGDLGIGKYYGSSSWHYLTGIVDEVKIYNRVLTPSEVQDQYNSGKRYLTSGTWASATLPWLPNYRFVNTTITHSGLSATEKITEVRWKVGATTKAVYSTAITSGSKTTITNSDLTSGNFNFINNNFNIEISMAGSGDATPVIEQVDGTSINTAGTLTSEAITLTTNNVWSSLSLNKTVPVNTTLKISVLDGGTDQPLSGFTEFDVTSIDLSSIDPLNHPTLKLKADFTTTNLYTPQLHDWAVFWSSDPPVQTVDIPSDWSFPEDTKANDLIELTDYFEDIWTTANKLKFQIIYESDNAHIDASIDRKFLDFTTPTINWSGSETFRVKCTDEGGLSVNSNEFKVTVTEVNDPPAWTPIGFLHIDEDSTRAELVDLDEYICDCDDELASISYAIVSNNNPANVYIQVENRHIYAEPIIENYHGDAIIKVRADDGSASANISVTIIIDPLNDQPIIELLSPTKGAILSTSSVKLTWSEGFDVDSTIVSYDVYLDDISPPQTLISNDQTVTSFSKDLEDGTYYWTVIPYDGIEEAILDEDKIWSFTVNTYEDPLAPPPTITLSSPYNNTIINTENIELFWNGNDSFTDLKYFVYFDTEPKPNKIIASELTTTNYYHPNLVDGVTYYWTVIPISDALMGSCEDGVWSFSVQLDFVPIFGVELSGIDYLNMNQSETRFCNLTVTNEGNVRDIYTPELDAEALSRDVKFHNLRNIILEPEESALLTVLISLPEDASLGYHNITVTVSSYWGGKTINDTHKVQLKIEPKALPPSDTTSESRSGYNMLIWIVLLIIVIIILIAIAAVMKRRSRKMEEALAAEGIAKPGAASKVLLPDIIARSDATPRLGAAGSPARVTVSPAALTPVVRITATGQPVVPQISRVPATPQLPQVTQTTVTPVTPIPAPSQPHPPVTPSPPAPSTSVPAKPEQEMTLDAKLKLLNVRLLKGEIDQELYQKLRAEFEIKSKAATPPIQPKLPPASPQPLTTPTTITPKQQNKCPKCSSIMIGHADGSATCIKCGYKSPT